MQGRGEDTTDDWNGELLAPVMEQWWPPPPLRPEYRRMRAVLEEALAELTASGRAAQTRLLDNPHHQALLAWFASGDRSWPFSFENICDAIDLDAERVRAALRTLPHSPPRWL
jgi:hypothetical protein